nr:flagellar biosynthetic protein FliO [Leifsonia psychrotolerans]
MFLALRVLLSLAAVLAVIWFAHKRLTSGSRAAKVANPITVISRQGLAQKASVVIIEAEGQRFVLGVTEQAVNVLYQRESSIAADEFAFAMAGFDLPEAADPQADSVPVDINPAGPKHSLTPPASQGMLRGSILSAETWKLSFAALRQGLK